MLEKIKKDYSLTNRFAHIVVLSLAVFTGCVVALTFSFTNSLYEEYEKERIERAEVSLRSAYYYIQKNLKSSVQDWANWDDAYRFVKKPGRSFIERNLNADALSTTNSDLIAFADDRKQLIGWAFHDKIQTEKALAVIGDVLNRAGDSSYTDFFISNGRVYLFVVQKVRDSLLSQPPRGYIVKAVEINEDRLQFLKDIAGLRSTISITAPDIRQSEGYLGASQVFKSRDGASQFFIHAQMLRQLKEYASKVQLIQLLALLVMIPFFLIFSMSFLRSHYIKPLKKAKKQLLEVLSDDEERFVEINRKDEIGELLSSVNQVKRLRISQFDEYKRQRDVMLQRNRLEAIGEMASGFAHEINNPLAIIRGKLNLLEMKMRQREIYTDYENYISSCYSTIERISKIISSLKNFSSRNSSGEMTEVSAEELVESVRVMTADLIKENSINFSVSGFSRGQLIVCNSIQIQQVLINLICNSAHAVSDRSERWIRLQLNQLETFYEISVTDSGHGIAPEVAERIFDPFFSTKKMGEGTGIGLSLSFSILSAHNGRIYLDRTSPQTRFVLEIPKSQITARSA